MFLAGNDLPARWEGRDSFVIVETGFGLGVNFLAAWGGPARRRRAPSPPALRLRRGRPFAREDLAAALAPSAEPRASRARSSWRGRRRWRVSIACTFDGGNVILTLLFGDARAMLPQLVAQADAFFLDGFAPARNPEMWSPEVVRELARLAAPGATLATWTVAGGVRAALADAGFAVEKRPGFAAKREMLVGRYEARARATRKGESVTRS